MALAFDLRAICNALASIESKWFKVGVQLGIDYNKLEEFKKEDDPLAAFVNYCLKGNLAEPFTWKSIITALKSDYVGEPQLAMQISEKYCQEIAIGGSSEPEQSIEIAEGTEENMLAQQQSSENAQQATRPENGNSSAAEANESSSQTSDNKMDPKIKMDLEFILKKNLKDIITKYASYVDCVRECIEEKGIIPEKLQSYLLSLPATTQSSETQELFLLSDKKKELLETKTIVDIFNFLTTECASFLNYDIFQTILQQYAISSDRKELGYHEHLKSYIEKHKIIEFVKINPSLKPKSGSVELELKYDIENTCRLAKIVELEKSIAEILDISPSALHIIDIKDGCIIVTFSIPISLANSLFTPDTVFTPQQEDKFQTASIQWLKCNGQTFNFEKKKQNIYRAFRKLEDHLKCSVCLDTYKDPKRLQCHHVYCQQCLSRLVAKNQLGLTCPSCRQVTPVPASGVADLQSAFQINKFLDIVQEHKKSSTSTIVVRNGNNDTSGSDKVSIVCCSKHEDRELELYCDTCREAICFKCIMKDEKHHNHKYQELSTAFEHYKNEITSSLEPLEGQLLTIQKALAKLDSRHEEIFDLQSTIESDIHSSISQLHEILNSRETELISQLCQLTQTKLKSLAAQRDQLETTQARLNSCLLFMREHLKTDNQREAMLMKSTTVRQVKELTATFQPDTLEPTTEADMSFSTSDITAKCQTYGNVSLLAGHPVPSNCHATYIEEARVGKKFTIILHALNKDFQPCKIALNHISSDLVSEISSTKVVGEVERNRLRSATTSLPSRVCTCLTSD